LTEQAAMSAGTAGAASGPIEAMALPDIIRTLGSVGLGRETVDLRLRAHVRARLVLELRRRGGLAVEKDRVRPVVRPLRERHST
jgi:hypothetical protein